ncbi:hypothetical protein [Oceanobacillus rekensis]|uniref:hypothetical protein n=1 Tax=Oceanobacillus rekensis TaxID=937927 RepID=UPI000B43080E|nr:hypothetical protein [Oceanobacillus rekensis]
MKTLKIYKDNNEFVIERVNEFNHATKRTYISEEGLKEALQSYKPVIEEYEIEVSKELWAFVINYLGNREFQD